MLATSMQATIEVDARPASVYALTDDGAATSGLTGMEALLQRLVVYEALVPPGAVAGQRVQPHMQPHIQLTLPFGAVPAMVWARCNSPNRSPPLGRLFQCAWRIDVRSFLSNAVIQSRHIVKRAKGASPLLPKRR